MKKIVLLALIVNNCFCLSLSLNAQTINKIAGSGTGGYSGDGGSALTADLNAPVSIVADRYNNEYISDKSNSRIRKVSATGIITTYAGTGSPGYSGDGGPATAAMLNTTAGIAVDTFGNVYVADQANHCIRKINAAGTISTVAGTGTSGFSGDGGPATAATLYLPEDVCVDRAGNLYIADYGNSRVRKVNTSGIITTLAGLSTFGSSGDGGPATAAQTVPYRIAVDAAGNVYGSEFWYHKIRKINTSGIISTIVGNGTAGFSGDGGPASAALLDGPYGVAVDKFGDIFINDVNNRRIRKVDAYGIISTYGGTGTYGYSGDGGQATAANIGEIRNLAVNDTGDVFMADISNHRCRVIRNTNVRPSFIAGSYYTLSICENATASSLNTILIINDPDYYQTEMWTTLLAPAHGSVSGSGYTAASTGGTVTPSGFFYTPATGYSGTDSFKVKIYDGMFSDTITVLVSITPLANAGVISGAPGVCFAGTTTLTETVSGGTWSAVTGNVSVTSAGLVTGLSLGTDTVRYTYANSCGIDSVSHNMIVESLLDLGSMSGPDSVCPGFTVTMTHSYPGGVWVTSDTTKAKSLGGGVIYGVSPGDIKIMYIVTNSCGPDTVFRNHFIISSAPSCITAVSTIPATVTNSLTISPNPSQGTFSISYSSQVTKVAQFTVSDFMGRSIKTFSLHPFEEKEIALDVAPGLYFITANINGSHIAEKIIVAK